MELTRYFRELTAETNLRYVAAGIVAVAALLLVSQSPQLSQPETNATVAVSLEIDYGVEQDSSVVMVRNGSTAFKVLNSSHRVNYTEYSFGYFVTGIDGVQQNSTHSWLYFVNGEPASKAVNRLRVYGGSVEFRFISNNRSAKILG
ncbi:MAG: DUF4430 domain-containing protein [Candidatus Nanohaloarchaea archaeon]